MSCYVEDKNTKFEYGNAYSITFPSEAGTVYGGTLTVNQDGSGELSVNSELEVFDQIVSDGIASQYNAVDANASVSVIGDNVRVSFVVRSSVNQSNLNRISSSYLYKLCNMLPHYFAYTSDTTHWYRNTVLYCYFPVSLVGNTREGLVNYLTSIKDTSPLSLWIPYITPIEHDLTASQVKTLLGTNHIFADTGAIQSLTYSADPKLYIDNKITQAVAAALNA